MTFDYLKPEGNFILKNRVNINNEELSKIYDEIVERYATRKSFDYETTKQGYLVDNNRYIVRNFNIVPLNKKIYSKEQQKMMEGYNVSYDLYEKPDLCILIEGIINPDTFAANYEIIASKLASLRKEKIERLRFEMDQEVRKIEVMLDDPGFDYYLSLQKIRSNEKRIVKLCEFDREYAILAKRILDTIEIQEIDRLFQDDLERVYTFFNENGIANPNKVLKKISSC